jgi:hypothetical protein
VRADRQCHRLGAVLAVQVPQQHLFVHAAARKNVAGEVRSLSFTISTVHVAALPDVFVP